MLSRLFYFWGLAAVCWTAGCGRVPERQYVLSQTARQLKGDGPRLVREVLAKHFGTPREPRVPEKVDEALVDQSRLAKGSELYRQHCLHCHGVTGDGNGPTAGPTNDRFLWPPPRDFRLGKFKFTSTPYDARPVRADLMRTLTEGIPGTAMPSFVLFPEEEREALVDYVVHLSMRGEVEALLVDDYQNFQEIDEEASLPIVVRRWEDLESKVAQPATPMPAYTEQVARQGRELFLTVKAQCVGCHGRDARGRGEQEMNPDAWGNDIKPADLTLGIYRGGRRPVDLYLRIATGITGTPMPAFGQTLSSEEIWQLVHFVRSLPYVDLEDSGEVVASRK